MTNKQRTFVAPGYICPSSLPYASDIFYHNKICYFLPTGFLPTELDAVYLFPEYCSKHNHKLPELVWEMFNYYFKASEQALTAANILSPLKGEYVDFLIPIYARGIPPIKHCNNLLKKNLYLRDLFYHTNFDMSLISREFLAHLFLDPYNEMGNQGLVEYISTNTKDENTFTNLLISILINRFQLFSPQNVSIILYEHSWYNFLTKVCSILQANNSNSSSENDEDNDLDFFSFKLFESILLPIYGKVNTEKKANIVASAMSKRRHEIHALKNECRQIALKCSLYLDAKDKKDVDVFLKNEISNNIIEPLNQLVEKPKKLIKSFVTDVVIDSGVISGLLSLFPDFNSTTLLLSGSAAVISSGCKMLLSEASKKQIQPSNILLNGMASNKKKYMEIQNKLKQISLTDVIKPKYII